MMQKSSRAGAAERTEASANPSQGASEGRDPKAGARTQMPIQPWLFVTKQLVTQLHRGAQKEFVFGQITLCTSQNQVRNPDTDSQKRE